ncbi:helix-turn-helix domain-containing protein [Hyphomicrobium sp. CS1GBMeth3]|uniref:MerR family transcriptional regulator n=1 Tax=Hyphomicrobium sp. CS1GBMeth3 TaxID=1892845 RepID=UPI000931596C|nr:helix-turn-helix domain-containing protein [Hyphomicrobium sp. CS1GBMeth3]
MRTEIPIGGLARATGVKVPTIRYYESIGLLSEPPRSEGNRRLYDASALERLRLIRHARELGFEVDAIRELLALAEQPQRSCAKVDALAREHLAAVSARIARLTALKAELETMIRSCAKGRIAQCHILEALASSPPSRS